MQCTAARQIKTYLSTLTLKQNGRRIKVEPLFFDFREFRRKVEELYFNFERRVPDLRLVETGELEQRNS